MNNKPRFLFILILAGAVLLTGLAAANGAERSLRVGIVNSSPMFGGDLRRHQDSLPLQILRYAAEKEKWRLAFVETSLPDALTGLERGKYDLVAVVPFVKEQAKRYAYSRETVISSWAQIYGEERGSIKSPLDLAGMVIGVHHDDPYNAEMRSLMRNLNIPCKFVEFNSYQEIFQALEKKWIQAGVVDRFYGAVHNAEFPDLKKTDIILSPMEYRYALPIGQDEAILSALDYHVGALKKDPHSLYYRSIQAGPFLPVDAQTVLQAKQVKQGLFVTLLLLALAVIASLVLRWQVKVKTAALTVKNDELHREIAMKRQAEEALIRQKAYLTALHETSLDIAGRLKLADLLEKIVVRAGDLVGTKDGFIYLYQEDSHTLRLEVGSGNFVGLIGTSIPHGSGLTGKVIATGEPMMMTDYASWPERLTDQVFDSLHAVMAVPLHYEGTIKGVIGLGRFTSAATFSSDEVDVLSRFSNLASIALNNARLYTKIEEELQQRIQAEKAQKRLEDQLRQNQKMEAIGTLAGGIAHDFNNILAAIIGYTELAIYGKENQKKFLKEILNGAERAKNLVRQILTFSRQGSQEKEPLDIKVLLKEAVKFLRASIPATIEITLQLTAEPCIVMADTTQMHQIIMNLCTNAAHAMQKKGGIMKVEISPVELNKGDLPHHQDLQPGAYVKLSVSDTGHGIDPALRHRIFEPFFTTKSQNEGTGLGLSVVYGIVKSHGGAISVYSEPDIGTTFNVYLPMITLEGNIPETISDTIIGGNEKILFVDDEHALVNMANHMLSSLGYEVLGVTSSIEALDIFRARPAYFDIVITDMNIPKMTGIDLSREILKIRPDVPIVLCSGINQSDTEEQVKSLGLSAYCTKPITRKDYSQVIRKVLSGHKIPLAL